MPIFIVFVTCQKLAINVGERQEGGVYFAALVKFLRAPMSVHYVIDLPKKSHIVGLSLTMYLTRTL